MLGHTITVNGVTYPRVAWTGGAMVYMPKLVPLARALYREQLRFWKCFWHDMPDEDVKATFKERAWGDAYASYREMKRERQTH